MSLTVYQLPNPSPLGAGMQLGHQAAQCTVGTINWRQLYGESAFQLNPTVFQSDIDAVQRARTVDYAKLDEAAKAWAKVGWCGGSVLAGAGGLENLRAGILPGTCSLTRVLRSVADQGTCTDMRTSPPGMALQRRQEQLDNPEAQPLPLPLPGMDAGLVPPPAAMHLFPPPYGSVPLGAVPAMPRPEGTEFGAASMPAQAWPGVCGFEREERGRGARAGPERAKAQETASVDAVHAPLSADGTTAAPLATGVHGAASAGDAATGHSAGGSLAGPAATVVSATAAAVPPPAAPPPEVLPEGWAATKDGSGKTYYWHRVTKKTQWTKPTADTPIN